MEKPNHTHVDVVLIGGGIMSATLGILLKELQPGIQIKIIERLDIVAAESTDAWNNAGTGHSAFCELNYTPEKEDGSIDVSKAIKIAELFEISKEFWAYLVKKGIARDPSGFINTVPHMSFVWSAENVAFLKKRHDAMIKHPLFRDMKYSENIQKLTQWMPLVMKNREVNEPLAATRIELGTDVNFGSLTRAMFRHLERLSGVQLLLNNDVTGMDKNEDGSWTVTYVNAGTEEEKSTVAGFVFIGAGGGSLPLLEKSGIKEAKGYGGFPVSGQWLVCNNQNIIDQHSVKVYGLADVGAPPMSVPHLDTRKINGKKSLLFGPFAGFSTKFLKHGSFMDLPKSIKLNNIIPMISAGIKNLDLTKYLIQQVRLTPEGRLEALKKFIPDARLVDWDLEIAGQRVQVIKRDEDGEGVLEFGTEVVTSEDGSISALLGASPGASVSVSVMLDVLKQCFKEKFSSVEWQSKIKEMIPSYGLKLDNDPELCVKIRRNSSQILKL